jgi:hypothetical protein
MRSGLRFGVIGFPDLAARKTLRRAPFPHYDFLPCGNSARLSVRRLHASQAGLSEVYLIEVAAVQGLVDRTIPIA